MEPEWSPLLSHLSHPPPLGGASVTPSVTLLSDSFASWDTGLYTPFSHDVQSHGKKTVLRSRQAPPGASIVVTGMGVRKGFFEFRTLGSVDLDG